MARIMARIMVWLRSGVYFLWFVAVSVVIHIAALPTLLMPRRCIVRVSQFWGAALLWGLKVIAGLKYEIRGEIPRGRVLIAAKHMSMWDTLALYMILNDTVVVLKKELKSIPFYGWYAAHAGMIFINRQGHAGAVRKMAEEARAIVAGEGRTLVIFPEGHRKRPHDAPEYKAGISILYGQMGVPCVPAALNSGLYWTGKGGFLKMPGTVVLEFLPAIAPGMDRKTFMAELESRIEGASNRLLQEGEATLQQRGLLAPGKESV